MLNEVRRSIQYNQLLDMIYMDNDGSITKRRVKVFKITEGSFQAYCYLRGSKRTFKIDNVLELVPVTKREGMVV